MAESVFEFPFDRLLVSRDVTFFGPRRASRFVSRLILRERRAQERGRFVGPPHLLVEAAPQFFRSGLRGVCSADLVSQQALDLGEVLGQLGAISPQALKTVLLRVLLRPRLVRLAQSGKDLLKLSVSGEVLSASVGEADKPIELDAAGACSEPTAPMLRLEPGAL